MLDAKAVITDANPATQDLLGRPLPEIVGRPLIDFLAADLATARATAQRLVGDGDYHNENLKLNKAGVQISADVSASRVNVGGVQLILMIAREASRRPMRPLAPA